MARPRAKARSASTAQVSLGLSKCAGVAAKDRTLVEPLRLLKALVHGHSHKLDDRLR